MNYGQVKNQALKIMKQYSIAGSEIPASYNNQADYLVVIPGLVNEAMMEIATTVRKLPVIVNLGDLPHEQIGAQVRYTLPDDFYQLVSGLVMRTVDGRLLHTNQFISALQSISDPLLEMSMLQGIQDLIDNAANYGDDGSLVRLTASTMWSYLSQTVPTSFGQAERTTELNRMQTYTDANSGVPTDWQYMVGKLSAKVPKWDYAQVVYTDAWGRTEANAENYTLNALRQFFSPGYVSDIHSSDMEKELSRLYEATGNSAVLISKPGKYFTYGGERVDLTADQYLTYNTTRGQEAYTALTALVRSTAYRNSSDEDKAALVGAVYSLATEIGKSWALGGEYQSKTLDKFLDVNRAGVSLADYVTVKASLDLNGNGSISQTEASEVLDGSGLSSQQKAAMWKSINSGWKSNPYE